jgi:hypothetical protein
MTDLTQQLEDKKKGCRKLLITGTGSGKLSCGDYTDNNKNFYCDKCQEIITIIEQAIAEIKNIKDIQDAREQEAYAKGFGEGFEKGKEDARQGILDKIDKIDFPDKLYDKKHINMYSGDIMTGWEEVDKEIKCIIKEQLNQPKTTQ